MAKDRSYRTLQGERRTSVTVRLSDEDLALLDKLAQAGYGVYGNWSNGGNYCRKRGPAIRQAIRDAAGDL